ncbi:hypothetical protein ACF1BP_30960 [Streptomyces sp. NPDC014735]
MKPHPVHLARTALVALVTGAVALAPLAPPDKVKVVEELTPP